MISQIYAKHLHENLKPFFANWEPDFPIKIGDYGYVNNNIFQKIGNIVNDYSKELYNQRIELILDANEGDATKSFKSDKNIEISLYAKGELVDVANAAMKVSFGNANSVFFNASGCNYITLSNFIEIGQFLIDRYANKAWQKEFYIVTDIMKASTTLVLICEKSAGEIILESKISDINQLALNDVLLNLKIKTNNCVGYSIETKENLIPMFRLAKITETLIRKPRFKPLFKKAISSKYNDNARKIQINFEKI